MVQGSQPMDTKPLACISFTGTPCTAPSLSAELHPGWQHAAACSRTHLLRAKVNARAASGCMHMRQTLWAMIMQQRPSEHWQAGWPRCVHTAAETEA